MEHWIYRDLQSHRADEWLPGRGAGMGRPDYRRNGQVHHCAHRKLPTYYTLISAADAPFLNKTVRSSNLKGLWISAGKRALLLPENKTIKTVY